MAKQGAIWGGIAAFITLATAVTLLADVSDKADGLVQSEAEALADHEEILLASEQAQQTQAGFNAYTLRLLLEQEIEILELFIEAEEDEDEKKLMEAELEAKKAFIQQLEDEEHRQMMKGAK